MAKKSMIEREKKRARTRARYAAKRAELKAVLRSGRASDEEKWEAQVALQQLPRNASAAARSPAGPMRCIANSVCAGTNSAKPPCAATCRAWSRPVGKPGQGSGRGMRQ